MHRERGTVGRFVLGTIAAVVVGGAWGCGSTTDTTPDAGTAAPDAGSTAPDAGTPAPDAGNPAPDAGNPAPDAGNPAANACAADFAGCTTFTDATGSGADRTILFGGATGTAYAPKCLRIKVGQAVTFSGAFGSHPLVQACGPASALASTSSGSSATFTLNEAGIVGYFCQFHGTAAGSGMAGAIEVVP
jgi:plastocyanin